MAFVGLSLPVPQALKPYTALVTILILLAYRFASKSKKAKSLTPTFVPGKSAAGNSKQRWLYDSPNLLQEAYTKFYGKPFKIWTTEGDQVVIPPDYVDELKMLPDNKFPSALRNFFLQDYLWPIDSSKLDYGHAVMKNDLNKNMSSIFPDIKHEIDSILPLEFPGSKEWQPVQVYPKVLRCVARVNAKIFVGSNLHLNQEWIEITCSYVRNIFLSSAKLRFFPALLRPIVQYFIPELRAVWKCNSKARDLLAPILREREIQEERAGYTKPNDSVEWLRDLVPEPDRRDAHFHGISQLGISAVSVNTTSQLITNAIFNLCTWPEYIPVLREEVESVLRDYGGEWTLESMGKLQKLDSFLKETLRHSGHLTATFQRKALQPITLSDGTHIPPGTMTFSPANAVNFDPDIYPEPDTFDGLRFYKLRQASEGDANRYQLTSITKTQLQFGSGRHACPGRWFAAHQNKLVVATLIQQYDIKFKDGEGRPKGILFQTNQFPDPKAEVLFRIRLQEVGES